MRQFALARLVLSLILGAAVCASAVSEPGAAESSELARLAEALAATETKEGPTSPYLLPLIEEIARFRLRQGDLAEAAALRRRALDIAIARFGCDSASAAEAMVALALVAIDRRRYLDAEPLLVDCHRLLDQRQRLGKAVRSQFRIGKLRQAARRVGPVGPVMLPVLGKRFVQDLCGFGEALLGGQRRAERAQRLGRSPMRISAHDIDRAPCRLFRFRGVSARQRDAGQRGQAGRHCRMIRRDRSS